MYFMYFLEMHAETFTDEVDQGLQLTLRQWKKEGRGGNMSKY